MIKENSVGVDYHQGSLQVSVMTGDGEIKLNRSIANEVDEFIELVSKFGEKAVITAEACNGTASFLDEVHLRTSWRVKMCHPGYVQRMRHSPDKTDKSDSELLADLTRVGYLPEVYLAPKELRELRTLVRYRALNIREVRATKVRVRALLRNNRIKLPEKLSLWTKAGLAWLESIIALEEHSSWVLERYLAEIERKRSVRGVLDYSPVSNFQFFGVNCCTSLAGCESIRCSTSTRYFQGSIPCSLQHSMSV